MWVDEDNVVLMQYTDHNDKDGNKIYEDDILLTKFGEILVVVWEKGGFCVQNPLNKGWGSLLVCANSSKIIGNKHENPELLKGESDG